MQTKTIRRYRWIPTKVITLKKNFPGSPVVKTPRLHCRGRNFDHLLGN